MGLNRYFSRFFAVDLFIRQIASRDAPGEFPDANQLAEHVSSPFLDTIIVNNCPPRGLIVEALSYSVGESELQIDIAHAIWFVLLHSASWSLSTADHTRPRGIVLPFICGTINFQSKSIR